jgi:hypothetical protein
MRGGYRQNAGRKKGFAASNLELINVLFSLLITVGIFYSGNIGQRISDIETSYVIDTNTLNNSFISLSISTHLAGNAYENINRDLVGQMAQFNEKFETLQSERTGKQFVKMWLDRFVYALIFCQILTNVYVLRANRVKVLSNTQA